MCTSSSEFIEIQYSVELGAKPSHFLCNYLELYYQSWWDILPALKRQELV